MKNKHLALAIITLTIAVILSIAVVSCKKDKEAPESQKLAHSETDNMDAYLLAFKKKLITAEKGGETINLEQAEQDLGNLLNFDFGDANYATNELQRDTLFLSLRLAGEKVDMAQLAETYNEACVKILEAYKQVELPEKSVFYISCSIQKDSKKDDGANLCLILTTRGRSYMTSKISIDTTDNWLVTDLMGKCDGSYVGYDHAKIIEIVYLNSRGLWGCPYGRVYFTNFGNDSFNAGSYLESDPNIHYNDGFRLWHDLSGYETYHHCVEYPEMQYYYNNFVSIINQQQQQLQDYYFEDYVITDVHCRVDCVVGFYHPYWFICDYNYAKFNCTTYQGPDY